MRKDGRNFKGISSKDDYTLNRKTEEKIKEIFKEDIDFYESLC